MWIFQAILLAFSLCADCFAVSTCSSVTLKEISWRKVFPIALAFGIVQTLLLFSGWKFGEIFVGYIQRVAGAIGFLLLLYVGGAMLLESAKDDGIPRDLNGIRNVVIGAFATSIDAFAVGVSLSMVRPETKVMMANLVSVFAVTILSVAAGMFGGCRIGRKFGRPAEMAGGIVLIAIGLSILL